MPHLITPVLEPGEEWFNVILHFTTDTLTKLELLRTSPPIAERFLPHDDIWIEHLDSNVAMAIVNACSPANFNTPVIQQQNHVYAFVR
jgi:hypothetical protein